jgi:Transposase DDE domain
MRRVLATPDGRALYRRRQATIEPVFGQLNFNRQIRRFQRRGRAACRSEWRLIGRCGRRHADGALERRT